MKWKKIRSSKNIDTWLGISTDLSKYGTRKIIIELRKLGSSFQVSKGLQYSTPNFKKLFKLKSDALKYIKRYLM